MSRFPDSTSHRPPRHGERWRPFGWRARSETSPRWPAPLGQLAVRGLGHTGAALARFFGVTTYAVNLLAVAPELPEFGTYLKSF